MVRDFEELVDAAGLEKFAILGGCQGAAVGIAYAVRHPERVTKLIINGTFANGWPAPGPGAQEHLRGHAHSDPFWLGRDNPAFRQLWTTLFRPDADSEEAAWLNELQRVSSSPENAASMMAEFPNIRVLDMLPKMLPDAGATFARRWRCSGARGKADRGTNPRLALCRIA